jgi:DNA-directed RNA polymerase subunit M/transcription elongation factor TFIIS
MLAPESLPAMKKHNPPPPPRPTRGTPICPRCLNADRTEEEDQTGSSTRWFVCERCGLRFSIKP